MAFILHQTWDAAAARSGGGGGPDRPAVLAPLLANGRDLYFRKSGATLLSIVVHILLIWLFLNKLAGNADTGEKIGAGSGTMLRFTLSDPAAAAAASTARQKMRDLRQTVRPPSELDATVPTELPTPEWTVSRLPPTARPQESIAGTSAAAAAGATSGVGGAGAGAGRGGSEVYDPFAGAAPLRREGEEGPQNRSIGQRLLGFFGLGQASAGGLMLDEAALETVRRAVARSLPGRRGTAELVVRVSPTGVVLEVSPRGGSAPPEARNALARALVGKRLYRGAAGEAQTLALPIISFG